MGFSDSYNITIGKHNQSNRSKIDQNATSRSRLDYRRDFSRREVKSRRSPSDQREVHPTADQIQDETPQHPQGTWWQGKKKRWQGKKKTCRGKNRTPIW